MIWVGLDLTTCRVAVGSVNHCATAANIHFLVNRLIRWNAGSSHTSSRYSTSSSINITVVDFYRCGLFNVFCRSGLVFCRFGSSFVPVWAIDSSECVIGSKLMTPFVKSVRNGPLTTREN